MAFDWSTIEGYKEELSAEEKLALLANYEMPKPQDDADIADKLKGYIPKAQFDKASSEIASLKKQLRSKLSEEEMREQDRVASEEAMRQELETLRKEKKISSYTASYLSQGYSDDLASAAAVAMAEGDTEALFAVMNKHKTAAEKALRAQILKETPIPPAGDPSPSEDEEEKRTLNKIREAMGLAPLK